MDGVTRRDPDPTGFVSSQEETRGAPCPELARSRGHVTTHEEQETLPGTVPTSAQLGAGQPPGQWACIAAV